MAISTAVDPSAVARVIGIKTKFSDLRGGRVAYLPQRIAVIGQCGTVADGSMSTTKRRVTSAVEVGQIYGFGSPLHLAVQGLLPANGDGVGSIPVTVYPLKSAGTATAGTATITPSPTQATVAGTFRIRVGGVLSEAFSISVGDAAADVVSNIAAAINSTVDIPVFAVDGETVVTLTTKWKGLSANGVKVEVIGTTATGITLTTTSTSGGTVNPSVAGAISQIGDVWETMVLNCLNYDDLTALDALKTAGDQRWEAMNSRPFVAFCGTNVEEVGTITTIIGTRPTDRVNAVLTAPGSPSLPFVIAARQVARIAKQANNDPAHNYDKKLVDGVVPGTDLVQWDYAERDLAVKSGCSTTEVADGAVRISDVVTFYHPSGDPTPAYRFVVDVVKLMNIIFNLNLIFAGEGWAGAPLIPDNQATTNRSAKQPRSAVAAVCSLLDNLGLNAVISDPETAKENTSAEIDPSNPKRLNVSTIVQLSGNTSIISVDLNFGFYFGG